MVLYRSSVSSMRLLTSRMLVAGIGALALSPTLVPRADLNITTNGTAVAPLPSKHVKISPAPYHLDAKWDIYADPVERIYHWTVEAVTGAPDGFPRLMYTINGQFPGPLIEANSHDNITVYVRNGLNDTPVTVHWHGLYQNGSQIMDGTVGFTQCPIAPGGYFKYHFNLGGQYGTYFWHAHYSGILADGLVGPIVIHSPDDPLVRGTDYDEDALVLVSDWLDMTSNAIKARQFAGVKQAGAAGVIPKPVDLPADAYLINGRGQSLCNNIDIPVVLRSTCNLTSPQFELPLSANRSTRLRLINTGAISHLRVSIDAHTTTVVELDGTSVYGPNNLTIVPLAVAQRTSVIVNATRGEVGDTFWMRVAGIGDSGRENNHTGLAIVRYVDPDCSESKHTSETATGIPTSKPWNEGNVSLIEQYDLDERYSVAPRVAQNPPAASVTHVLDSSIGIFKLINGQPYLGFGYNNVSWQAQTGYPLLEQIIDGRSLNSTLVGHIDFDNYGAGDIIINNLDYAPGPNGYRVDHPFHLHGQHFSIVGRGLGRIDADGLGKFSLNTTNPPRRDTITIRGGEWAAIRLETDTPGVWALHCHVNVHLGLGKMAAVIIQPDVVRRLKKPESWKQLCASFPRDTVDITAD